MSSLQKRVLMSNLPSGLPPRPTAGGISKAGPRGRRDYTPIHYSKYFTSCRNITIDKGELGKNVFCVYEIGSDDGPLIFMLHGGGFSGLTWSLVSKALNSLVKCRIIAMDIRGHGSTITIDDTNLSEETLANDICDVIENFTQSFGNSSPDVVLVGHSMGGALAVHAALAEKPIANLVGVCVIDVVEGTAMEALASMQNFLRSRPAKFKSLDNAIEWCVRSGQVRNTESARVSMPGQLCNTSTGYCAINDVTHETLESAEHADHGDVAPGEGHSLSSDAIVEEEEHEETDEVHHSGKSVSTSDHDDSKPTDRKLFKCPNEATTSSLTSSPTSTTATPSYTWKIDLTKTEKFWTGWFGGLSNKFLSVPASKLLLLAGVDRLDRDLTVGQMQGKFQMQILPQAGHAVHEDVPDRVAEVLASFLVRNKFATAINEFTAHMPGC